MNNTVTFNDLVKSVAEEHGLHKSAADAILRSAFTRIRESTINKGSDVRVPFFGKFKQKKQAARPGRNPATGVSIDIPALTTITFRPAKALKVKDKANKKKA